jgi:4-amino-4-deoxy-L-arabinose transferase-like glycosyltransferase
MIKTAGVVSQTAQLGKRIYRPGNSDLLCAIGALILIGMAVAVVSGTWATFTATYDEPFHIACGMQWIDKGVYIYGVEHPPLARIVLALGPYLKGARSCSQPQATIEGNAILYSLNNYWSTLASARSGNLLFLVLACVVVFLWARRWFGKATGFWAVLLFVSLPPILGHAGLATLDMACAASAATALYQFLRFLENPVWRRSILLGASLAFAFLCKFSTIPFLVACFAFALVYLALVNRGAPAGKVRFGRLWAQFSLVAGVALFLCWAGYRFSVAPPSVIPSVRPHVDRLFGRSPVLLAMAHKAIEVPLPLAGLISGIGAVQYHNQAGHGSYLLGEYRSTGWWYFFPVAVGVKTPIGFLVLAACGLLLILRGFRASPWQQGLTAVFPAAIMLVCMISRINLGVRHILPMYPMLAVAGGYAISELLLLAKRRGRLIAVAPMVLVLWVVAGSWAARPDFLAYFNELAGGHGESILVESDLDWGQDLRRLSQRLKDLRAEHVSISYFGTAPLERAELPPFSVLWPDAPVTRGYVAVSARYLFMDYARDGSFGWLKRYTPSEVVGKSIYLYDLGH